MTAADELIASIRRTHVPVRCGLDETGSEGDAKGHVCTHGGAYGYRPAWPCHLVILADEVDRLNAEVEAWKLTAHTVGADNDRLRAALTEAADDFTDCHDMEHAIEKIHAALGLG